MIGTCPHCKSSDRIVGLDTIEACAEIQDWTKNEDGTYEPNWEGSTDVLWDTQVPQYPDQPYYCRDCDKLLAASELIFTEEEDN